MTGPAKSKTELEGAKVYVHRKDRATRAQVTHVDIEHPDLNEIIEPGESTFVGGKRGGVFLGLKGEMIDRAEAYLAERADEGES